jgi:hypothetical protein
MSKNAIQSHLIRKREHREKVWRQQHANAEHELSGPLEKYFNEQAETIGERIEIANSGERPRAAKLLDKAAEHKRLMRIVEPKLRALMVRGASMEQALFALTGSKAADAGESLFTMPERILQAIREALDELEDEPYWEEIQAETETRLTEIINTGLEAGDSNYTISMDIREQLGGFGARRRALMIARTEATGSLNAGHEPARKELIEAGVVIGRRWLTIGDADVRDSHAELEAVIAYGADGVFDCDGEEARWPGDCTLSPENRIRCRCTTVSVMAGEDDEGDDD